MRVEPASSVQGGVVVPGDKSISHRAVLLGAVDEGDAVVENFGRSADTEATVAAMRVLGIKGTVQVTVGAITDNGPSEGHLQVGDVLTTVDGKKVNGLQGLRSLISSRRPGQPVVIGYTRAGKSGTVRLRTAPAPSEPTRAVIGIEATTRSQFPVQVDIKLQDVGGPSAGLMFALGIIDKLQPGSLTGGRVVAGTGEIDESGRVGPIGGIAQKMRGAVRARASVFLVPSANCSEAKHNRPGHLVLAKVGTIQDALDALAAVRAGRTPASC